MIKKLLATFAVGLACVAFAVQVNAVPISGKIDFFGNLTTDTGNLNTANKFNTFSGVTVVANSPFTPTGSYTNAAGGGNGPNNTGGTSVAMNGFTFKPGFIAPVPNLWSFTILGTVYSFDLLSITSVSQPGNDTLTIVGQGLAHITGFSDTAGQFFISTQGPNAGSFTFSSTTTALPEGGSALALLGIGLIAVEVVRRKVATA